MGAIQLSGSCLCGSVAYEISGELRQFNHCHCERCRKLTGSGHATNIIMSPSAVRWIAGEGLLDRYDVPEAKRFAAVFCRNCGSPMPRLAADGRIAVVPAGSLDNDPQIVPQRRIFLGSRAAWSCAADDVPGFDTYPPSD